MRAALGAAMGCGVQTATDNALHRAMVEVDAVGMGSVWRQGIVCASVVTAARTAGCRADRLEVACSAPGVVFAFLLLVVVWAVSGAQTAKVSARVEPQGLGAAAMGHATQELDSALATTGLVGAAASESALGVQQTRALAAVNVSTATTACATRMETSMATCVSSVQTVGLVRTAPYHALSTVVFQALRAVRV